MDKNVQKWFDEGFITEETAKKIDAEIKEEKAKKYRLRVNITLYTLSAILIGIGVISFIAANDWILKLFQNCKILKILLMTAVSCVSLFYGYKLSYEGRNYPKLGGFLVTLSAFLIGGTYAIIGQTYNYNSGGPMIYFLWLISILPTAYIFRNNVVNIMSVILFCIAFILQYDKLSLDNGETWTVFMPVVLGLILYQTGNTEKIRENFRNFSLQYKVVGLNAIYITLLILVCSVEDSYELKSPWYIIPVCGLILWSLLSIVYSKRRDDILFRTEIIFSTMLSLLLIPILIFESINTVLTSIIVHAILITLISFCFYYGYKEEREQIAGLANRFLTIYLAVTYCRWGWDYMEKSAFFLVGGLTLLSLGIYLERKKKEIFLPVKQAEQIGGQENE